VEQLLKRRIKFLPDLCLRIRRFGEHIPVTPSLICAVAVRTLRDFHATQIEAEGKPDDAEPFVSLHGSED